MMILPRDVKEDKAMSERYVYCPHCGTRLSGYGDAIKIIFCSCGCEVEIQPSRTVYKDKEVFADLVLAVVRRENRGG